MSLTNGCRGGYTVTDRKVHVGCDRVASSFAYIQRNGFVLETKTASWSQFFLSSRHCQKCLYSDLQPFFSVFQPIFLSWRYLLMLENPSWIRNHAFETRSKCLETEQRKRLGHHFFTFKTHIFVFKTWHKMIKSMGQKMSWGHFSCLEDIDISLEHRKEYWRPLFCLQDTDFCLQDVSSDVK